MPRRKITAGELMETLAKDPEYVARAAERDRQIEQRKLEFAKEEAPICDEAKTLGYRITSVWDFVNNVPHAFLARPFTGPYPNAYPLLVRHLGTPHHPKLREGLIRALTVRDGGRLVIDALLEQFR